MSWIRSSKSVALVVLLAVSLAAVGGATALSLTAEGVPSGSQVGDSAEVTITIEDPFVDMPDRWTLAGSTGLSNASWRVTVLRQGDTIENGDNTYSGKSFEQPLNASNGGDTIEIVLEGDTPRISSFSYSSNETFTLYDIDRRTGNTTRDLNSTSVYHYTNKSRAAREAIMKAEQTLSEVGGNDEAQTDLSDAKQFYNNGQFNRAITRAQSAQETARSSQQSSQLLLFGGIGVVAIVVVAGGVYYYQSQQDDYGKLQ